MELILFVIIPLLLLMACVCIRYSTTFTFKLNPIPIAGLFVVLSGVVLGHEFFNKPVGPIPITLDRILLMGTTAWFGYLMLCEREFLRPLNTLDKSILFLLVVVGISTVTHDFKYLGNMPLSRLLFFNLMPAGLYYLMRSCRLGPNDLKAMAVILSLFGVYLAVTAVAETKGFSGLVFPRYIMTSEIREFLGRGRGPFLNPVSNGIFMTTCFCCTMMWWPRISSERKPIVLAIGIVILLGIYLTLTRSVWLSFIITGAIFIFLPANRQQKGALMIAGTLGAVLLFPVIGDKIFSFKRDKEVSVSDMKISAQMRPMFFNVASNMFKDRPILGVGFGQYAQEKHPYLRDPKSGLPLTITKTLMQHNVFLAYLTETGLVGIGVLLFMLAMMFHVAWQVWRDRSLDLWARQFGLVGVVMMTCYCTNGLFHDVSIIPMQHVYMFFLLGLVNNIYTDRRPFRASDSQQLDESATIEKPDGSIVETAISDHVQTEESVLDQQSASQREPVKIGN